MRIVIDYPPNIEEIKKHFPIKDNVLFTYGDKLYAPGGGKGITDDLMAHEETHSRQQAEVGVDEWWKRYFEDPQFRFEQELEAYRNQYRYALEHTNRKYRRWLLKKICNEFSGSLYGYIVTFEEATKLIEDYGTT